MRYAQGSKGQLSYGIEGSKYSKADAPTTYFGYVTEDVDPPNPNEHTPMSSGGTRRGPTVNSPDPHEYSFDIPVVVYDHNVPFEVALGERTTTTVDPDGEADSGDEYDEHLITEADKLPTMTVEHQQADLGLKEWYIGAKASLSMSASSGDPLQSTLSITAASHDYENNVASGDLTSLNIPTEMTPYRFWMKGDVTLSDPSDDSTVKTLATVDGMELSWDNGLEGDHHGNGRDAYSVAESTAAEKYDHTLTVTVTDTDLYRRAAENEAAVDIEIPFYRDGSGADARDALFVRLLNATLVDAPVPNPNEGNVEAEIGVQPTNTEIEIHTPA